MALLDVHLVVLINVSEEVKKALHRRQQFESHNLIFNVSSQTQYEDITKDDRVPVT